MRTRKNLSSLELETRLTVFFLLTFFFSPNIFKIHEYLRPQDRNLFGEWWEEAWLGRGSEMEGHSVHWWGGNCCEHLDCLSVVASLGGTEGHPRTISLSICGSRSIFSTTPFLHCCRGASGHSLALLSWYLLVPLAGRRRCFHHQQKPSVRQNPL